jgi:hypothetical protein
MVILDVALIKAVKGKNTNRYLVDLYQKRIKDE